MKREQNITIEDIRKALKKANPKLPEKIFYQTKYQKIYGNYLGITRICFTKHGIKIYKKLIQQLKNSIMKGERKKKKKSVLIEDWKTEKISECGKNIKTECIYDKR